MVRISFARHFTLLTIATAVLAELLHGPYRLPTNYEYIAFGALHALTILGALRPPRNVFASVLLVGAGAVLSQAAFFVGLFIGGLGLIAFAIASAFGAASYGTVLRLLWFPSLPGKTIGVLSAGCALATAAAVPLASKTEFFNLIITIAWWWTFSGLLWWQLTTPWRLTMRWSGP
jgi:hypothetical protein